MIETYGLSHIQLSVRDLERSIRFYRELLGMEELHRLGTTAVMMQTPGCHEVFTLNARPDAAEMAGQTGGIAHFGFRLRQAFDMAALGDMAARAGGTVLGHGARGEDKSETYLFVNDPDGYEVELFFIPEA